MRKAQTKGTLALVGYEDIFMPTAAASGYSDSGQVVDISLDELYPPEFHPFQVNDDQSMTRLSQNIKLYGVREPGLARPRADGYGYELIVGNRRKRASELAGLTTMPVIIRDMDDDSATLAMVDSNLEHREKILPSEKAWAYRVKLEALNHNGVKGDMLSVDVLVEQTGESKNQIFRLVRLTELIVTLLDKVDSKKLAFNPAVELSYLSQKEQLAVSEAMEKYEVKPSLSQAVLLKKMKQAGTLSLDDIDEVLAVSKKTQDKKQTDEADRFREFFPTDYTVKQINGVIADLLREWQARQTG